MDIEHQNKNNKPGNDQSVTVNKEDTAKIDNMNFTPNVNDIIPIELNMKEKLQ